MIGCLIDTIYDMIIPMIVGQQKVHPNINKPIFLGGLRAEFRS